MNLYVASFIVNYKFECEYLNHMILSAVRVVKICRDTQCFRSLNKNKDHNKLCRRCLNSTIGYKKHVVVKGVLNVFKPNFKTNISKTSTYVWLR